MLPIRRLALSVDESDLSAELWREACALARLFDAELVPIHVTMDDRAELSGLATRIGDRLTTPAGVTKTEVHLYRPGISVAESVLAGAADHKADMIMIGAGAKSTLDRVFLGSTAEAVSRRADVPVWIVRPAETPRTLKTILCAVDNSQPAQRALESAFELARLSEAKLVLLAVVPEQDVVDPVLLKELELRDRLAEIDQSGVDVWVEVLKSSDPVAEILEQAKATGCDVLVIGQAGREGLRRLWDGNTADSLIRSVPCSLLTVRGGKGRDR